MTGLIWTMQVVHYPLFSRVGNLAAYETENMRITSWLVIPPMVLELALAGWLAWRLRRADAWIGLALAGVIWLSTFVLQAPAHAVLATGAGNAHVLPVLLASNWIRTIAWTARGAIALRMVDRSP